MATLTRAPANSIIAATATATAAATARPAIKGSLTLSGASDDTETESDLDKNIVVEGDASFDADFEGPWWLSSDSEHAHTACPLRPFAHMVVGLRASDDSSDACTAPESVAPAALAAARIVHLSDALRRKMHSVAPDTRADRSVGDMLVFAAPPREASTGNGLWGVLGWLVGSAASKHSDRNNDCSRQRRLFRRRPVARRAEDDPLLVGNEGLGAVEIAAVRTSEHSAAAARGGCVFALCAHAMAPETQARWLAWHAHRYAGRTRAADDASAAGLQLAVVHVAEVSTLHRVASLGVDALVPPPLPMLEQSFAQLADSGRVVGPPPAMPPLAAPPWDSVAPRAPTSETHARWLALLVSRHGLVEMAHPLARTPLAADDPSDAPTLSVALGAWLGESLFGRIHPEDVVRVVRALRLAWDARPDSYHFARLRRLWQQKRRAGSCDRIDGPAIRQVLRSDGIEVTNGVVELNVQLRLSGPNDLDWADPDAAAVHSRFARVKLTRWPLVLRPSRASAEPQDGFVLVAMQPLPEPSGARRPCPAPAHSLALADAKKRSISSVASAATLVSLGSAPVLSSSASDLSCLDSTARPSVAADSGVVIPASRLASRRRSNIMAGSLSADADELLYSTPRELRALQ
ncbi:hypothetical protein J3B02_000813 [Coemansia erecta]|nr:hypothetical protein J3B02_000813 [Coemansia erecta]